MCEASSPEERLAILRVLDANANRAVEGLRVVEEYLRFVLEDRHLAGTYKQLRHDLVNSLAAIPAKERMAARDTPGDVGTSITASDEFHRGSTRDIAAASQKRVEQALRCLEEFAKPLLPQLAQQMEQLRYTAYSLAKAVETTVTSHSNLANVKLYVLLDAGRSLREFDSLATSLLQAGAQVIQLRDKGLADRELLTRANRLRELTRNASVRFIMNDRPDLALLADADGVHVGQEELRVADARRIVGPARLVGVSTHSMEQARQAVLDGADYIGCGPTFPSQTKSFVAYPGCEFLQQVASEIRLPAFAIGGITLGNLEQVLATGLRRVAIGAAITHERDPGGAVSQFLTRLR